jgi:amino acid adenylation domain-containing protein
LSPGESRSIQGILRRRAEEAGDRLAYAFLADGEIEARLDWAGLDARARALAAALRELGVHGQRGKSGEDGGRVVLLFPPGLAFVTAFFGCLYAGAVAIPALPPRPRRADPRLSGILRDARPQLLLTSSELLPALAALEAEIPELAAVPRLAEASVGSDLAGLWTEPAVGPDSLAVLQYTSGSTATPKGVMVRHGSLLHNEELIRRAFGQSAESVIVGWLPLFHDMGLIGNVLQPLWVGASCYLMSPLAFLQRPLRWLEAIDRFRATTSGGPDFAYELCVRKIGSAERERLDLSCWRAAFNGAEPVRASTLARFAEAFAPCGFRPEAFQPCYGLAEATLLVAGGRTATAPLVVDLDAAGLESGWIVSPADKGARRRALVGCGCPLQEVVIVDPEARARCPEDRVGEVWVRSESVAAGYWERPEETSETFGAFLAAGEGPYLRTGDLGFLCGGELFLTGRSKDLIVLRGRNHYPQDLELTVERSHPDLRPGAGAAFAVEAVEEGCEERLVLVHETARHPRAGIEEIAHAVRRAVAEEHGAAVSDLVLIRPESLPRTSSGKVRRRACREAYLGGGLTIVGRSALSGAPTAENGSWAAAAVIDRAALLGVGPQDRLPALEVFLRGRAAEVLRRAAEEIAPETPLTALGLDSLAAASLKAEVEAALGLIVPLAELLGGAGTAALAARLAPDLETLPALHETDQPPPLVAAPEAGDAPLSLGQKALWFLHRLAPAGAAYNLAGAARIVGGADEGALRRAVQALTDRHDMLRATFAAGSAGPVQRISTAAACFVAEDASSWSAGELRRRLHEEAFCPFDLEHGPVFRAALFTRPGESFLVLAVHHIAADFASLALLAQELGALYSRCTAAAAETVLPPLELRFTDFALWQESAVATPWGERLWEYWRGRLADLPPLDLPTDRPRPAVQTWRGATRRARLGADLQNDLRALARRRGETLFMLLLAGFQALLARWSGQDDFAVGVPTSGRLGRDGDRLAGLVGYFVNPIPLRADLAGDPTVGEWLERTRRSSLAAFEHQDFPLASLVERLHPQRDPSRPPLFQALLALHRAPTLDLQALAAFALGEAGARLDLGGLVLESIALESPGAQLDLTLTVAELDGGLTGDLAVGLQINADLFEGATAERMLGHLAVLLRGLAAPGAEAGAVSSLPLLSAAERGQLELWNSTATAYGVDRPLHVWIEEQAALSPEAVAVVGEDGSLTYRELLDCCGRLARRLRRAGVAPRSLVGIAAERSAEMVTGLLAILQVGAAYVPLDPSYPRRRLEWMLADSGVRVLLTQERLRSLLVESGAQVVLLDGALDGELDGEVQGEAQGREPDPVTVPDDLAYVIYTSGSTGRPKGAMNTHRGIVNRLLWMQQAFALTPEDRVLHKTPFSFDVSVWELFWPLMTGARLVLARPGSHQDPAYLGRRISEQGVTTLHFVPSMLHIFLDELTEPELAACSSLRRVIASGEALSAELAVRFRERLGRRGVELHNLYGPTEAAVDVTWQPCDGETGERPVPIGRPIANTRIHLLDRAFCEVPVGVAGELCIGGVQLARGYLGRPELTAERFIPDLLPDSQTGRGVPGGRLYRTGDLARRLPDGAVEFLGRLDHQVKVRGFRVELGEVEAALAARPEVREAVAAVRGTGPAARLVAWVVPAAGEQAVPSALREALRQRLPEPMVPSAVVVLPALPLTPNGKVDRRALPEPEGSREGSEAPFVAPRTPGEKSLAAIWREILGVERIGVHDHFFDLGGHSLLAMQLLSRVREAFGVEVPLAALFEARPTVENLARAVFQHQVEAAEDAEIAAAFLDLEGMSDEEIRALLESEA